MPEEICSQNVGVEGKQEIKEATAPIIPAAELQESGHLTGTPMCECGMACKLGSQGQLFAQSKALPLVYYACHEKELAFAPCLDPIACCHEMLHSR